MKSITCLLFVLLCGCSSPVKPSPVVSVNVSVGQTVTVQVGTVVNVADLPSDLAPWHGSWDGSVVRLSHYTNTRWTFTAVAPGQSIIALTDNHQWVNAVDTPMRRYYVVKVTP